MHTFNECRKTAGKLRYAGGTSWCDAHRDSWARQKTGGFRCDAHYGHGKPHAFRQVRQAFLGIGVKPPYRLDVEQLLAIDEVTYAMSGVGLNGADYLIEIIAGDDEDLWRVVDESIRSLPGVDQTWWASTVSVEKRVVLARTSAGWCTSRRLMNQWY